ncbi:MAG: AAA family ATPase [Thermoleophilaceae bacterium]|nr:AAA family ATPase [Thermoleophilaceae bacterium]
MEARARTGHEATASDGLLFERGDALALIAGALDGLEAGHGSVVALDGPFGSGKTAVLEAGAALARERGYELLSAHGREHEQELELGVALQLFESRLGRARGPERERLLEGPARAALPLFDAGPSADETEAAGSLVHGLYRLVANLAGERPLVLAIDDVDLADAATFRFLLYLANRIEPLPVAIVLGLGSAPRAEAADLLDEVLAHRATRRYRVEPLRRSGTAAWLRASFFPDADDAFCSAVRESTGGMPWLVREVARELATAGVRPRAGEAARARHAAPEPVAATLMRRARAVDHEAASLLEAAAVLGPEADLHHAAALAGLERQRAAELMDRLAGAGILAPAERLSFAQPVLAAAVHAALPAGERSEAHLAAARALMEDEAPAEAVAGHLLLSGRGGGDWVTPVLRTAAARALAIGTAERAVELLERARREPPPPDQRAHVLLELGRAQAVTGAPEALARLTEAIEQLPASEDRAGTALETGRILMALGRLTEAGAAFDLGLRFADEGKGDAAGLLRAAGITAARLQRGRAGKPAAPGLVAPERGDTPADRALLAQIALDAALRGDPAERVRHWATEALARGALLEDDGAEGIVYYLATSALTLAEDLQMAEVALAAAMDYARSHGSVLGFATASHFQSVAVLRRGRLPAAAEAARAAIDGARHGWRFALGSAHVVLAGALTEAGELDAAEREIRLAERMTSKDAASRVAHHGGRAQLHLARGRPAQALADFLECGETLVGADAPNPAVLPWRSGAARALAALGDRTEARRYAEEELALAESFGAPGATGRALRTLGALAGGKRSIEALQAAVACLEESQTALERARALVDLGSALRRARHTRDAREPLRRGLDLAQRCGAAELTERAMREVTAAGARPRRTALHGLEALTPRELQTAELAAAGKSNREIADALVVTVKTVEWHLKHSYGKLGINSRAELADALGRRPNVSQPRP